MQGSDIQVVNTKASFKTLLFWVRFLLLCCILGYIGFVLRRQQQGLFDLYTQWISAWQMDNLLYCSILLLLTPLNWALEALKWQGLARKLVPIDFVDAFRGVLAGLSLGFATPNTLGDYAGRIGMLSHLPDGRNRMEGLGAVLLGRVAQLYVTLLTGCVGLFFFSEIYVSAYFWVHYAAIGVFTLLVVAGVVFIVGIHRVKMEAPSIAWRRKVWEYLRVLTQYTPIDIVQVLLLSFLRYAVFSFQFILLLWIFHVNLPITSLLTAISLMFMAKSSIPAFHFLSDLGVREFSALYFFGFYHADPASVVAATLSLWLLNILLPALYGTALVWKLRV